MSEFKGVDMVAASDAMTEIVKHLSEYRDIPDTSRAVLLEVYDIMLTNLRNKVDVILLPVVFRLRERITNGDVKYFASEDMMAGVGSVVKELCGDQWDKEKSLGIKMLVTRDERIDTVKGYIVPILTVIKHKAIQYNSKMNLDFEKINENLLEVVSILSKG